jgi:hypothetical protein
MTRGAQDRLAPSDSCSTLMKQFVFTHYFSELRVLFQQKMNSDGIVFWKKEVGIVFGVDFPSCEP